MKYPVVILVVISSVIAIVGCSQRHEYDGLYTKEDFISSDQSIRSCTVIKNDGDTIGISWLMQQTKRNTAVEMDLAEVKSINLNDLSELTLKYPLEGEIKFTIGTDIASWKQMGYKPLQTPCTSNDEVLSFIHPVKLPFSKKSKDGLIFLSMGKKAYGSLKEHLEKYKGVAVYGLIWEDLSEKEVNKGWVFKIER